MVNLGPYEPDNLYCGECADMMSRLPDNCIDLTVTSPPYDLVDEDLVTHPGKGLRDYQGYDWDFVSVAKQLWRVTKEGGVVVWVVGDATVNGSETGSSFRQALYFKGLGFRLHDTMIYQTNRPPLNDRRYEQEFDFMFVFSKNTLNTFTGIQSPVSNATKIRRKTPHIKGYNKYPNGNTVIKRAPNKTSRLIGNIWFYRPKTHQIKTGHPAPFPEALARDHIISWSNPGDLILDPFVGSGTVPKMGIEQGRRFLGFDISQEYVGLARRRIQSARIPLPGVN